MYVLYWTVAKSSYHGVVGVTTEAKVLKALREARAHLYIAEAVCTQKQIAFNEANRRWVSMSKFATLEEIAEANVHIDTTQDDLQAARKNLDKYDLMVRDLELSLNGFRK